MKQDKITFIVQARSGSTRMPEKILLPFYKDKSILDLLIEKLKSVDNTRVLIATTENPKDERIVEIARKHGVAYYRGSEEDVLDRFIQAARSAGARRIIRVCSDNPFLDIEGIRNLVLEIQNNYSKKESEPKECGGETYPYDYIGFDINGIPSIKTHYGFWTEFTTLDALERVSSTTDDRIYHEHVTNYMYIHPEIFKIKWIEGPGEILKDIDLRLTIDTPGDFRAAAKIYSDLKDKGEDMSILKIIEYLSDKPELLKGMSEEIKANSK